MSFIHSFIWLLLLLIPLEVPLEPSAASGLRYTLIYSFTDFCRITLKTRVKVYSHLDSIFCHFSIWLNIYQTFFYRNMANVCIVLCVLIKKKTPFHPGFWIWNQDWLQTYQVMNLIIVFVSKCLPPKISVLCSK